MTTTPTIQQREKGIFAGFVDLSAGIYLIGMLLYFALRLALGDGIWWIALLNAFVIYTFSPLLILLPLLLLLGLWRTFARLSILAALSIVWFGPFFQPQFVAPAREPTLRIATYNLWGGGSSHKHVEPDNLKSWVEGNRIDVAVFQEVSPEFIALWANADTDYFYADDVPQRFTVSRYPIVESSVVHNRFLRTVLDVNGQSIAVYNVHLSYPVEGEPRINLPLLNVLSRYDETKRNKQIDEFLDWLKKEPLPYIAAGDFNMSQHSIKYSSLAVLMDDSWRETRAGLGATWSTETNFPLLRLDYVWYSAQLRAVKAELGPDLGSDHLPVIAEIELPPKPPASDTE